MSRENEHRALIEQLVSTKREADLAEARLKSTLAEDQLLAVQEILQRLETFRGIVPIWLYAHDSGRRIVFAPHDCVRVVEKVSLFGTKRTLETHSSAAVTITITPQIGNPRNRFTIEIGDGETARNYDGWLAGKRGEDGFTYPATPNSIDDLLGVLARFVAKAKYSLEPLLAKHQDLR